MWGIVNGLVFILLAIAGVIDWKRKEIPVGLLIVMSVTIFLGVLFCGEVSVWYRVAGAVLGVVFFIISKFTKEAVGYGDSWLILLLGAHLGIFQALQTLFVASFMAAVFAVFYLWKRKWKRSETLPFVPFLSVAYIGVMFV